MKRAGILFMASLTCIIQLNGCGNTNISESLSSLSAEATSAVQGNPNTDKKENTNSLDQDGLEEDMVISTKYGDLHYDGQWKDSLKTMEKDSKNQATVKFSAEINDESYPLFSVIIGGDRKDPVGTLTGSDDTKRNVYIKPYSLKEDNNLTNAEQDRFHAMKDSINYLIDNLE